MNVCIAVLFYCSQKFLANENHSIYQQKGVQNVFLPDKISTIKIKATMIMSIIIIAVTIAIPVKAMIC